jgi:hypothetical protein
VDKLAVDAQWHGRCHHQTATSDGAALQAWQVEFRWPASLGRGRPAYPVTRTSFPASVPDLRDQLAELALSNPLAGLRDSLTIAASLPGWASGCPRP